MNGKSLIVPLLVGVATSLLAACGSGSGSAPGGPEQTTITTQLGAGGLLETLGVVQLCKVIDSPDLCLVYGHLSSPSKFLPGSNDLDDGPPSLATPVSQSKHGMGCAVLAC
jgi:hypothetical protein